MSDVSSVPGKMPASWQDAEQMLFHFDQAWRQGTSPRIDDYLAGWKNTAELRQVLEDLVKIDLEYRWRFESSGSHPWTLERYVKAHSALGELHELSLELIGTEYLVRQRWGDRPRHAEYVSRFPRQGARLLKELAKIDGEIAADAVQARPAPTQAKAVEQAVVTPAALVAALAGGHLLSPSQKHALTGRLSGQFPEPRALAGELLRQGWLTAYQVNQLLQARGDELVVGPYLLLERLGEGGAGQVFKARHRETQRVVALKLIRKNLLADPEVVGRFYREIQILSQLDHPNIVRGYEAGPATTTHFLAMEYVEGTDLGRLIKRNGPMPVQQACEYIRQAACGLAHAHEKGLVHRDIKPHNLIMSVRDGLLKVADLGLARLPRTVNPEATILTGGVQTTGTLTPENAGVMGTADYLAPEQAMDFHAADIRADIYSLGCTFYYLLTGQPPFAGGNLAQKVARHMQAEPPPVEQFRKDLPAGLAPVLRKMLAKRPENRYQTPAEVVAALTPLAAIHSSPKRRMAIPHLLANRRAMALAIGAVVLLGLVLIVGLRDSEGPFVPKPVAEFRLKKQDHLHTIAFSPNGKLVASAGADTVVTLWDTAVDKEGERKLFTLIGHKSGITHLAISPDNRFLASGSAENKTWKIWDLRSQQELATGVTDPRSRYHATRPFVGPFSPDSKTVAICHGEGTVSLIDVAGKEATKFQHKELPIAMAFSPDGRTFAMAADKLLLYDISSGKETLSGPLGGYVWAMAFSPDNTLLAAIRANHEMHVLDAATLKRRWIDKMNIQQELPSRSPILGLAFAPDGKTLACGGFDHQVKLWHSTNGVERATLAVMESYTKPVCTLGFSADGKTLYVGGEDDTVRMWRVR